jgi:hypothetical protein
LETLNRKATLLQLQRQGTPRGTADLAFESEGVKATAPPSLGEAAAMAALKAAGPPCIEEPGPEPACNDT